MSRKEPDFGLLEKNLPTHDVLFAAWRVERERIEEWRASPSRESGFPKRLEGQEASLWLLNHFVGEVKAGRTPPRELLDWLGERLERIVGGENCGRALGLTKPRHRPPSPATAKRYSEIRSAFRTRRRKVKKSPRKEHYVETLRAVGEKWNVSRATVERALRSQVGAGELSFPLLVCFYELLSRHPASDPQ